MNERIRELAEQAGAEPTPFSNVLALVGNDIEKFAELIIQECMSNLYLHGYDDARAQIKEHFGVEL